MRKIESARLQQIGKKHQKLREMTSVNQAAYVLGGKPYYLAVYVSKRKRKTKGYAIISTADVSREEALQALAPHMYFAISGNNIHLNIERRASLDFTAWEEYRDYVRSVIDAGRLDAKTEEVYLRVLEMTQDMISLQDQVVALWKDAKTMLDRTANKGIFTQADIDMALDYVVKGNLLQYKQFKDRYEHCADFDLVYDKREEEDIRLHGGNIDPAILEAMTSKSAKGQLKDSLNRLTQHEDVSNSTEAEIYQKWMASYKEGLDKRVAEAREMLRHPKK